MADSKERSGFNFKFVDQATSSKYACVVCYTVPREPLRAQCCGAIYCQQCAEQAETFELAELSVPEQQSATSSLASQSNPKACVCSKCKKDDVQLLPDTVLQKNISKLQIECPKAGCGWIGEFADVHTHMKEPHDNLEDDLYDNDFTTQAKTTQHQQSWAEQFSKAHTPSIQPSQTPPAVHHETCAPADNTLQETLSCESLQPHTTTDTQLSTSHMKLDPLLTQTQDYLCLKSCSCCCSREFEFVDMSTSEKLYVSTIHKAHWQHSRHVLYRDHLTFSGYWCESCGIYCSMPIEAFSCMHDHNHELLFLCYSHALLSGCM